VHAGANFKPVTIAVTPFAGEETGDKIKWRHSLGFSPARSSFCRSIGSFPNNLQPDASPNFDAWKTRRAQFVLTGRVLSSRTRGASPRNSFCGTPRPASKSPMSTIFDRSGERPPRLALLIADAVFSRVTGEKGFFDSRSSFVDETGPKEKRHKRLAGHGHGRRQRQIS